MAVAEINSIRDHWYCRVTCYHSYSNYRCPWRHVCILASCYGVIQKGQCYYQYHQYYLIVRAGK